MTFKHWRVVRIVVSAWLFLSSSVYAQLSGSVGPTTTVAEKAAKKVCNVLDYEAVAGSSDDFGPALLAAWNACASGGLVYIPPGTYSMATWVNLDHGTGVAIQWDGIIERTGTAGGTMVEILNSSDIEVFSGTSKGAIQGYGYEFISQGEYGPRLLRFVTVTDFSLHGIALIDSPAYYITCIPCNSAELYNLILRGIEIGETDGFDVSGDNIWVHDVEVTNGDECVTVKSPATNYLVESVHCNISGGCAMGSLGLGTAISNIHYTNIYLVNSGGFYIKTNGGSGTVTNCKFENFISHNSAYTLTINEYWGDSNGGAGVEITDVTYSNWKGENIDNSRPVVRLQCADTTPCSGITLTDIDLWTTDGSDVTWECESAFGEGGCLHSGSTSSYAASFSTLKTAPAYSATTMPNDLASAFPSTKSFTIPPVPTTYYPGLQPYSALLSWTGPANNGGATTNGKVATTTAKSTTLQTVTSTTASSTACLSTIYSQCGGTGWTGCTGCVSESTCIYSNTYYSQCIPI